MSSYSDVPARLKKATVWLTLCGYLLSLSGCTTTKELRAEPGDILAMKTGRIVGAISKAGEVITFNRDGGHLVERPRGNTMYRPIVGVTDSARAVELDPDSLLEVKIEQREANTLGTNIVIALVVIGVGAGVFINSWPSNK